MITLDMFKNPNLSENEMTTATKVTFWKDGKGWVEKPGLERKLSDVEESYADSNYNSHFYFVVGKIFPTVYSVYVNQDGTVQAAEEPSLPAGYVRHMPKCQNPLQKAKSAGA